MSTPTLADRWVDTVRAAQAGASAPSDGALTVAGASADDDRRIRAAGAGLLARWGEPHRRYHDLTHLAEVLEALDTLLDAGGSAMTAQPTTTPATTTPATTTVRLAAWFHDAVYLGRPGADEEASALLAHQVLTDLRVAPTVADEVARLVRTTALHDPEPGDDAAALLCDADLAILAVPPARYAAYAAAVRAEYAHVPDELFRAGRTAVLSALLEHESLYRTPTARLRWERTARHNIGAELERLADGAA